MPELPEVETVRRQLEPEVVGRTIKAAEVLDERWTRPELPARVEEALAGRRIDAVDRRGKYLIVRFDDGSSLVMHLRMTGNLLVRPAGADGFADTMEPRLGGPRLYESHPDARHLRARIALDDGSELWFTDARRFGHAVVLAGDELDAYFASRLGVEPLGGGLTPELLLELAADRRAPLKSFLLNQDRIAGIGNIYADEALFRAHLHPLSPAGSMKLEHAEELRDGIVDALEQGLELGGSSIDDYRDARGERGSMQEEFLVHTREGEPCLRCGERDPAGRGLGTLDLFLPGLPAPAARPAAPARGEAAVTVTALEAPPAGFLIGHWTDAEGVTGCTAVIAPPGARGGVDVRGGGPGTRETDVIGALAGTAEVTAVTLTGGSAFGLAAADGVMRWCEEQGRGYVTPGGLVPIVPAAVIYDLAAGDPAARPDAAAGYAACEAAAEGVPERGRVGAGTGAAVGKIAGREHATPTGVGYAAGRTGLGHTVAVLAVVNAFGDVIGENGKVLRGRGRPRGRSRRWRERPTGARSRSATRRSSA